MDRVHDLTLADALAAADDHAIIRILSDDLLFFLCCQIAHMGNHPPARVEACIRLYLHLLLKRIHRDPGDFLCDRRGGSKARRLDTGRMDEVLHIFGAFDDEFLFICSGSDAGKIGDYVRGGEALMSGRCFFRIASIFSRCVLKSSRIGCS